MLKGKKSVAATTEILGANPTLTLTKYEVAMYTRIGGNQHQKFKKNNNVQCDFCKMTGYSKENCFKIVGYPPDFKPRRGGNVGNNNTAYNINVVTDNNSIMQHNSVPIFNYGQNTNIFYHASGRNMGQPSGS